MTQSAFDRAYWAQCEQRPTSRADFWAGWIAALRWSDAETHDSGREDER